MNFLMGKTLQNKESRVVVPHSERKGQSDLSWECCALGPWGICCAFQLRKESLEEEA